MGHSSLRNMLGRLQAHNGGARWETSWACVRDCNVQHVFVTDTFLFSCASGKPVLIEGGFAE